jgi:hypothetical protein
MLQSKHGVILVVGQIIIFLAAIVFGFRLFGPRADEAKVDLPAISFNTARAVLSRASRLREFPDGVELMRSVPPLPVGVGIDVRPTDSTHAALSVRYRRSECVVQLRLGDTIADRPSCRLR